MRVTRLLCRRLRRLVFMKVNMRMRQTVVTMLVDVNVRALLQCSSERTDAQTDNHDRDDEFQPTAHSFQNRDAQTQHDRRDNEQRCRVAHSPERAHDG